MGDEDVSKYASRTGEICFVSHPATHVVMNGMPGDHICLVHRESHTEEGTDHECCCGFTWPVDEEMKT